ncbi:hypothetical protein Lal_00013178 [Lupinus albus]|nr:hypothetical protein Lal_00013178 [Lupinus albus]
MNKAFVKESDGDDDDLDQAQPAIPAGAKNYITPAGHKRLRDELLNLIDVERPEVVRLVSWAASNGDRSENGDYIYGKRRLREIDRRIRFLTKRLDLAEVVDASRQENVDQVFFGATVDYETPDGEDHTGHDRRDRRGRSRPRLRQLDFAGRACADQGEDRRYRYADDAGRPAADRHTRRPLSGTGRLSGGPRIPAKKKRPDGALRHPA